jgi:hypothetical protein
MKRRLLGLGAALTALLAVFGLWQLQMGVAQADRSDHPKFSVDPFWPKPLPNQWQIGQVPGISIDKDDNIWIVQRPRTLTSDERGASNFEPGVPATVLDGAARPQGSISDCCPGALGHAVRSQRQPAARVGRSGGSRIRCRRSRQQVRGA